MSGPSPDVGFVGRERELARVAAALDAAARGEPRRLVISGPGGIGVTTLIDETNKRVRRLPLPFDVIRCQAFAGRGGQPFAALAAGLGPYLDGLDDAVLGAIAGSSAEPIARLLPDLRPRLERIGTLGGRSLVVPTGRTVAWIAEAILRVLEAAAARSPVLFSVEDLHAADAATRGVAVFLARVLRPARLCVIASYASDELSRGHPLIGDLASMADAARPPERIELGPLSRAELATFVAEAEGGRPSAALVLLVAERSAGNPLLAGQLLLARRELAGVAPDSTLDDLVAARLAVRSPECRRFLRLLAPAEEPLDAATLTAAAAGFEHDAQGLPPRSTTAPRRAEGGLDADLRAGLDEAIAHGFVTVEPDGDLRVVHELVGRAVVQDLLSGQRRRIRRALGEAVAARPAASLRHLLAAHDIEAARGRALEASVAAEAAGSPGDALAHLEIALELGAADGRDRAAAGALLVRAADISAAAERPARALAYLEAALGRHDEARDRVAVAGIRERLGRVRRALGDHERALTEHRRAASLVSRAPAAARAPILASLAQALMLDGRFREAGQQARAALDLARAAGAEGRAWEGHALCTLGILRAWSAEPAEAVAPLEAAHALAVELGLAEDAFRAAANLTTALALGGRLDDSIATAMAAIASIRRDALEATYGNAHRGNVGEALTIVGRWSEARDILRRALEWSPGPVAFTDAAVALATLEVEAASDEATGRLLGRLLLELHKAPDPQSEVPASRAAASFALWRGDVADAARAAELGWSLVQRSEDWLATARMAACFLEVQAAIVGDARERRELASVAAARGRASEVLSACDAVVRASGVPPTRASRQEADARMATARAYAARLDGRDRPVVWDALARTWERVGDPYQVARARWRQAEAALVGSDARSGRVAARRPLLDALRIAVELGARPLERELRELAGRALISVPEEAPPMIESADAEERATAAVPVGPSVQPHDGPGIVESFVAADRRAKRDAFGLSAREREVLAQIAEGRTNREIGERLFISQKTVGVHVGNILAKLGASGRVEAAMVAVRLELVPAR